MSKDRNADDVAFIRALAELLDENALTEIEVDREYGENDRLSVRVCKQVAAAPSAPPMQASSPAPVPAPSERAASASAQTGSDDPSDIPGVVASPMVGTAYLSPEPDAEPFVTIGQQVSAGQTLMIIEAMKTMNHIPAPHAGTVKRILVEDGTPVEYGAPLMVVA